MEQIYNIPGGEQNMGECCSEMSEPRMEEKFVKATAEAVVEALDISWRDRRVVQPLLEKALSDKLNKGRDQGLIQQYEAYVLDRASERLRERFDIPKEVKVNYGHAHHAKYADIADWIDANYSKSELKNKKEDKE